MIQMGDWVTKHKKKNELGAYNQDKSSKKKSSKSTSKTRYLTTDEAVFILALCRDHLCSEVLSGTILTGVNK